MHLDFMMFPYARWGPDPGGPSPPGALASAPAIVQVEARSNLLLQIPAPGLHEDSNSGRGWGPGGWSRGPRAGAGAAGRGGGPRPGGRRAKGRAPDLGPRFLDPGPQTPDSTPKAPGPRGSGTRARPRAPGPGPRAPARCQKSPDPGVRGQCVTFHAGGLVACFLDSGPPTHV